MKSFRSLTQRVARWQQAHLAPSDTQQPLHHLLYRVIQQVQRCGQVAETHFKSDSASTPSVVAGCKRLPIRIRPQPSVFWFMAVLSLTSAIGYRFYNEPQLDVNTIAPQTLRAPTSARVLDSKTTEANRKAARIAAVPVLMIDSAANQEIYQSLQRLIEQGDELRQQAGSFPYVETSVLSTSTQRYLRGAEEGDWRAAMDGVQGAAASSSSSGQSPPQVENAQPPNNSSLQVAILELQNYRRATSTEDLSALKEVILRARQRYAKALVALATSVSQEGGNFYDASLFNLTDAEWFQLRSAVRQVLERVLMQGIPPGLPNSLLESAIGMHLSEAVPVNALPLARSMLVNAIKPNLIQDPQRTKQRAEQAARAVEEVFVEIRRGEVIVQAGQPITQTEFVLLDHFGLSRRRFNGFGLLAFGGLVSGAVMVFLIVEQRFHPRLRRRDHLLVLLLVLSAPLTIVLNLPSSNLPAIGLLVGSFYGSALGVTSVALLSLILPIGMEVSWTALIASAIGGLLGAMMAGRLRSREELALLGGAVGLTQGIVYLILSLMLSAAATPVWYVALTSAALQGLMGLAWSVVALGLSPYLEHLFDLVTPIRLAELSNPNRPLLKRLASETPGTFQHTLFVATLAEAAARELGCNVELVRAGTLYHDIGKMHDPQGFIENQMGGPNKHDAINDPWVSADIIKRHVSEGMEMARKYRLPKAVRAFIPEHQGTMLISYFYYQAQQRVKENPDLDMDDSLFRYDGPIPQSRETGIVMLADSCEAALRSLKEATPEEALAMINRILRARWQDDQLVASGLSRRDLTRIAEIFVSVWLQFNHQRIPYPKAALTPHAPSLGSNREQG